MAIDDMPIQFFSPSENGGVQGYGYSTQGTHSAGGLEGSPNFLHQPSPMDLCFYVCLFISSLLMQSALFFKSNLDCKNYLWLRICHLLDFIGIHIT